jgi:hypothetical protein
MTPCHPSNTAALGRKRAADSGPQRQPCRIEATQDDARRPPLLAKSGRRMREPTAQLPPDTASHDFVDLIHARERKRGRDPRVEVVPARRPIARL